MKSDVRIIHGGFELTEKMDLVESPDLGILPEVETILYEQNKNDGQRFNYKRNKLKRIPFSFLMDSDDYIAERDNLAKILNQSAPQPLYISLFPDRYWNAIVDGQTSFVRDMDSLQSVEVSIEFLIPDGIAHATQTDSYTTASDVITLNNGGTYRSWPILEATMPGDNGVVAFLNDRGKILQFGNPSEDDTRAYSQSERIIWDTSMTAALETGRGYKTNYYTFSGKFLGRYTLNTNGTRKFQDNYVTYATMGTGTGMQGLSYGRKVSADSEGVIGATNFECREAVWFELGRPQQTGLMLRELRDSTGKAICSIAFYKLATTTTRAKIRINVLGNVKEWDFVPNGSNIYTKKGKDFSIVKSGNQITFHVGGVKDGGFIHTVRLDELKDLAVTDVVDYFGVPTGGEPITRMCLMSSTLRKDKVAKTADIKNLFGEGDVLRVDTASGEVTINGLETQLGALGNDWEEFYLTPGINEITCIYSDWAAKPTFKLYNQEAYL